MILHEIPDLICILEPPPFCWHLVELVAVLESVVEMGLEEDTAVSEAAHHYYEEGENDKDFPFYLFSVTHFLASGDAEAEFGESEDGQPHEGSEGCGPFQVDVCHMDGQVEFLLGG